MNKSSFLLLILISLAVAPAFALGEGNRNLLLIGTMLISPFIILSSQKFYKSDLLLLLFLGSIVFAPLLNQYESVRWSTIMYTMMFGFTFIAYKQLLHREIFSLESYQKFLMYLIYAYFFVLLIQQFCVATGLPVFNVSNYNPEDPWKLNSLAAEPSHSARIVALLMYCYIYIKELMEKRGYNFRLDFKDDKWIWLAFLWTMLTMGSGTAFIFLFLVLLKFMKGKDLVPLVIMLVIVILIVNMIGGSSLERSFKFTMSVLTFDTNAIIQADHSASLRIVPSMLIAQMVDLSTINGWFGHGIDFVSTFLHKVMPGIPEGTSGGGLLQLLIEYGFMSFMLFIIFSFYNSFKKGDYLSIAFWFMLVFLSSVNSQVAWLAIILLFTNIYFKEKINKKEIV
jgi:hypothetical protein